MTNYVCMCTRMHISRFFIKVALVNHFTLTNGVNKNCLFNSQLMVIVPNDIIIGKLVQRTHGVVIILSVRFMQMMFISPCERSPTYY